MRCFRLGKLTHPVHDEGTEREWGPGAGGAGLGVRSRRELTGRGPSLRVQGCQAPERARASKGDPGPGFTTTSLVGERQPRPPRRQPPSRPPEPGTPRTLPDSSSCRFLFSRRGKPVLVPNCSQVDFFLRPSRQRLGAIPHRLLRTTPQTAGSLSPL